jgi:phytoene dehydrogenase-like protein
LLDDWFETDVLKGALAARAVTGLHQGPMAAGTAFHLLHGLAASLEPVGATIVPLGGMSALSAAVAAAARAAGAEIRTSTGVDGIEVERGAVRGVVLTDGTGVAAGTVLSNVGPRRTLLDLLEPEALDPELRRAVGNIRFRGACARVQLALAELPHFRGVADEDSRPGGLVSVSPSIEYLERAYDDAKYGRVSSAPYLEAVIPSLRDSTFAPAGRHVMSVLVQYAPFGLAEGEWNDELRQAVATRTIETLTAFAPNLAGAVLASSVIAPPDYEQVYGLTAGDPHHGEMTLDQVLFMRPVPGWSAYRMPVQGLFLCGAGAHPGGGVTGIPGRNAARAALQGARATARA